MGHRAVGAPFLFGVQEGEQCAYTEGKKLLLVGQYVGPKVSGEVVIGVKSQCDKRREQREVQQEGFEGLRGLGINSLKLFIVVLLRDEYIKKRYTVESESEKRPFHAQDPNAQQDA